MRGIAVFFLTALALGCSARLDALRHYKKDPSLPVLEGRLSVAGLAGEVNIYRDQYGVPHIFADHELDLFFAAGYVHAQDRLWEMVLLRAFASGRMSELFGEVGVPDVKVMGYPLSTVEIDRRQRTLGNLFMGEISAALLREREPVVFAQIQAYCDGVNAWLEAHQDWPELPLEFQLLRVKPTEWRPADIAAFGRFIGSMLSSNLDVELARWAAIKRFGPERGWELVPLYFNLGPTIVPPELLANKLVSPRDLPPGGRPSERELGYDLPLSGETALRALAGLRSLPRLLGAEAFGSNNWIVAGKLTESGYPILANDPHLNHLQHSLFYLMHLKGPNLESYGVTFPGSPYVVLGHNRNLAWGATTSRADVQDLFVETPDPSDPDKYIYKGQSRAFTVREETIRVHRGSGRMGEKRIIIRQSLHGPIINEVLGLKKDVPPLAYRWTGWDLSRDPRAFELVVTSRTPEEFMERYRALPDKFTPLNIALAMDRLQRGESVQDFIAAMDVLDLPNQNWIAADRDGHIVYLPGGLVPRRGRGLGVLPVPGESGEFDWNGFIPLKELPWVMDPERGYVNTSNNEVVQAQWYPYVFSTHYGEPWRALRIEQLLHELAPLSLDDMKRIQNDVYVSHADWLLPLIFQAVERKQPRDPLALRAVEELRNWDREASLESTATVIFYDFSKELFRNVMEDEVKDYKVYQLEGYPFMALNLWLERGQSSFFDDVRTREVVEDRDDMIVRSLHDTMAHVIKKYGDAPEDYQWGRVHYVKFYHPLALVGGYRDLSVGPFPHSGGEQTVRMAKGAGFGKFPYKALTGPCLRHLIDLGDPEGAQVMIDGSQSGQFLSPHYDDLHPMWVKSEYFAAVKDEQEVRRQARHHLILAP
jgi:penicillin amidase